jgi:hypothetical protein
MALPDAPVFLAQAAYYSRDRLVPVAAARVAAGRTPPGLLLDFGAVHLQGVRDMAANRGSLSPLLACSSRYDNVPKRGPATAAWVQRPKPTNRATWNATMSESLAEQRSLGVDALSLPGAELGTSAYPNEFERQTDAVRRAWRDQREHTDPPWFARFTLHDEWLTDRTMRRVALTALTDLPDGTGISLHVRFGKRGSGFDGAGLAALKEFVRVLANDDRRVLLIQSGIIGWLSIAWGAWGFSAGQTQNSWLDSREEIKRRKGTPSPPRLERYFEPQLLHHVLFPDHKRLRGQTGHANCSCAFCGKLKTTYNPGLAAQHDLWSLAELTERVALSDRSARRDAVRKIIEDAQRYWSTWKNSSINKRSQPEQLATWRALV